MAELEDLIASVEGVQLRDALANEVRRLKDRTRFGLVYERHLPESTLLPSSAGIGIGTEVRLRKDPDNRRRLVVTKINRATAWVTEDGSAEAVRVSLRDLLIVRRFSEPIFPTLKPIGSISPSKEDDPHLVIRGENYHALQLLGYTHSGKVDVIYIDPPYNTGASDWKYNNNYVDNNDRWRHSKWLSFMEKRLRLASHLLKPDSVMVVTIDENEVTRLGVLLQQMFSDADVTLVTIVNNPKGVTRATLSRVEEYAYFCFFGNAGVSSIGDDLLTAGADEIGDEPEARPRWKGLLRSGSNAQREQHPTFFYPILIDPDKGRVVGAGDSPPLGEDPDPDARVEGHAAVWPVRRDGSWGRWMLKPQTLRDWAAKGYVSLGKHDAKRKTWGITYLTTEPQEQIIAGILEIQSHDPVRNVVDVVYAPASSPSRRVKTVWHRTSHDAGVGGTAIVSLLVGDRAFTFPKSVYAVRDTLATLTADIKDALIVDFFAGSGTTLHSTAMLNAEDGGHRRVILVTNNELEGATAKRLESTGKYQGDPEFDRHGVFEAITRPRCEAAITGVRPDGRPVSGEYLGGGVISDGFAESVLFASLEYLDPARLEVGRGLLDLEWVMWLKAGARGVPPKRRTVSRGFTIVEDAGYAVLLESDAFSEFVEAIAEKERVTHVFLVTDYNDTYAAMAGRLPARTVEMVPRDYIRWFRGHTGESE